jgi:outer membrane immunogenic protein
VVLGVGQQAVRNDGGAWVKRALSVAVACPALLYACGAQAQTAGFPWLDEVRIGGATTVPIGGGATGKPLSPSVELEALFSSLPNTIEPYDPNLSWLFSPRPMIGASISAEGKTDTAYAALAWDAPIVGPYFAELTAGGLIHDQDLNVVYSDRPSPLTTRFLFRESIAVGRQIGPDWRILAFLAHASNGDLASGNVGINQVGVLLGHTFGPGAPPRPQAPPSKDFSPASFSWTGPYLGFGVGLATSNIDFVTPPGATNFKSVNLAGTAGYNWQIDRLVLGIEADGSIQNLTGTVSVPGTTANVTARSRWLATARGRLGVDLAMPFAPYRFLLYGTGGAAFTDVTNNSCVCLVSGAAEDQSQVRTGWTAGGGVEVPLAPTVTVKLEYLYVGFGKLTFSNPAVADEQFTFDEQIFRGGMNFKLN